jgi:hypothetical protein
MSACVDGCRHFRVDYGLGFAWKIRLLSAIAKSKQRNDGGLIPGVAVKVAHQQTPLLNR